MITVLASIQIHPGMVPAFLTLFKENIPAVLEEEGCLEYYPTVDATSDIGIQSTDAHCVTIVEKWESLDALQAHLKAPHMQTYNQNVKDMVANLSLKILRNA